MGNAFPCLWRFDSHNAMEKKRLRKQRIIAGLTGIVTFLMIITPRVVADGAIGFSHDSLGACGGMFIAIIAGIFSGYIISGCSAVLLL